MILLSETCLKASIGDFWYTKMNLSQKYLLRLLYSDAISYEFELGQ